MVVGISGGVDSAVTALLLKRQGFDVIGLFMQNWQSSKDDPFCTAEQDLADARAVCDTIGIPLQTVNFTDAYWDRVFQYCLDEFANGRTPNPDVLCNREIKFKELLAETVKLGASFLATGHYARVKKQGDHYQLLKGKDAGKDQSYFLYMLNQHALQHSLFPLGEIEKSEVREIAKDAGLINYAKKDSTGICFIGERRFKDFLSEFILAQPGKIKTLQGEVIGRHDGVMFYTIGQRKGLQIGGLKKFSDEPWYVADKDIKSNVLIVVQGDQHPNLFKTSLRCSDLTWVKGKPPSVPFRCKAKTRYRQTDQSCLLSRINENDFQVEFDQPQRAITPGQSVVFYQDDVCLGGGIIDADGD